MSGTDDDVGGDTRGERVQGAMVAEGDVRAVAKMDALALALHKERETIGQGAVVAWEAQTQRLPLHAPTPKRPESWSATALRARGGTAEQCSIESAEGTARSRTLCVW